MLDECRSGGGAERHWFADVPGQQVIDGVDRMLANAGENIAQVSFGLKSVHFCGADERVEDRGAFPSGAAAGEEPVLPSKAYGQGLRA